MIRHVTFGYLIFWWALVFLCNTATLDMPTWTWHGNWKKNQKDHARTMTMVWNSISNSWRSQKCCMLPQRKSSISKTRTTRSIIHWDRLVRDHIARPDSTQLPEGTVVIELQAAQLRWVGWGDVITLKTQLDKNVASLLSVMKFWTRYMLSVVTSESRCHIANVTMYSKFVLTWTYNKRLANAKRPCDCRVLYLRLKSSLCSCAHSISDMTSFSGRDQGRDSVCPVLWMSTWRNSKSAGKRRA